MTGYDGRGPYGTGPVGRRLGPCSNDGEVLPTQSGLGLGLGFRRGFRGGRRGRGRGWARGHGRRFVGTAQPANLPEVNMKKVLENQLEGLERLKKSIEERLENLEE